MSRDEWNELVRKARAVDMVGLVKRRGGDLRKQKKEYVGGGKGAIDLEMFLGGIDFIEAVKRLTGATSLSEQHSAAAEAAAKAEAEKRKRAEVKSEAEQHAKARWLWSQHRPAKDSLVEHYLGARGYHGPIPSTLGFLPPRNDYPPAMIAAYTMPNEVEPGVLGPPLKVKSVHLTRLLPDGSDRVHEKDGKITVGRPLGLPIAISPITDGLSLVVTEGIEDALAYAADGFAAWAAGSSAFFPAIAMSIPDYVTSVTVEMHPDAVAKAKRLVELLLHPIERPVREGERMLEFFLREAVA